MSEKHNLKILILDEPASGLDPRARIEMKEILKQLSTMGKTIIISSHILPELAQMCTEIGIIDKGQLKAQGTVNEIMRMLRKQRKINVKPLTSMEKLVRVVSQQPDVAEIIENQQDLEFLFNGDDIALAKLLETIVKEEIPLLGFTEKEGNLEEIFMQITGGEENHA